MHKARPKVCALRTFPGSETLITLILHIKSKMVEVTAAALNISHGGTLPNRVIRIFPDEDVRHELLSCSRSPEEGIWDSPREIYRRSTLVGFHFFIVSTCPLAVPLDWHILSA